MVGKCPATHHTATQEDATYVGGDGMQKAAVWHVAVKSRHGFGKVHSGWNILNELEMLTFNVLVNRHGEWTWHTAVTTLTCNKNIAVIKAPNIQSQSEWVSVQGLTSHCTHNRLIWRRVFDCNWLHRYWQANSTEDKINKTQNTNPMTTKLRQMNWS